MKFICFSLFLFAFVGCFAQTDQRLLFSGTVVSSDTVPLADVVIINTRTGNTVRTQENGFFQTDVLPDDSLLVYHISFKRQFINKKNNGRLIVLEPEIRELMQVDVLNKQTLEQNNLNQTVNEIKRLAPMGKPTGYDLKSRQNYFVDAHGSHNRGFSPFFGPTVTIPFGKMIEFVSKLTKRHRLNSSTPKNHLRKKK